METWHIYPYSVGCRLNQSELEKMARQFVMAGHTLVQDATQADVCVVNTCAVTEEAERKTRRAVRTLKREARSDSSRRG